MTTTIILIIYILSAILYYFSIRYIYTKGFCKGEDVGRAEFILLFIPIVNIISFILIFILITIDLVRKINYNKFFNIKKNGNISN